MSHVDLKVTIPELVRIVDRLDPGYFDGVLVPLTVSISDLVGVASELNLDEKTKIAVASFERFLDEIDDKDLIA